MRIIERMIHKTATRWLRGICFGWHHRALFVLFAYRSAWPPKALVHTSRHTLCIPLDVWTESIRPGKQKCAFIRPQSCFISRQGLSLSTGRQQWHHFTRAPACLMHHLRVLFVFLYPSLQTSSLLPLNPSIPPSQSTPQSLLPFSPINSSTPSLFFSLPSLLKTNTPQVGLSPPSLSPQTVYLLRD